MSIQKEKKQQLIKEYAVSKADTGSAEVQCAVLSERIKNLTDHMSKSKKDTQARRGLLVLVNRRKKLLRYVENQDRNRYQELIKRLGIRK